DRERDEDGHAGPVVEPPEEEGAEDGEIAVCEVDDPHHAEEQRQPGREQRVIAAEEHALHDLVDPDHVAAPFAARRSPKYACTTSSRLSSSARPSSTIRPSSMQATRVATASARP